MKTIIFAPAVFNLGETTRMIEVANKMRERYGEKYEYIFIGFSRTYQQNIEANGFTYYLLDPVFTKEDELQLFKVDQMKTLKHPFTYQRVRARVENELKIFERFQPEMVVTGTNMTVFLSARIAQIPLLYVKPFAMTRAYFKTAGVFVPHALRWFPFVWEASKHVMLKTSWLPHGFKKVAQEYQLLPPKYSIDFLDGDWNFITTDALFVDQTFFPKNYIQAGAIISRYDNVLAEEVRAFLNHAKERSEPLIYFAMGSSSNKRLVLKILKHLLKQNYYIVAPIAKYISTSDIAQSDKFLLVDFVSAHIVNQEVDFSIMHGGEGTVQTACLSGKPFIGIGLQYEQEVNIRNCERFGNAVFLHPKQVNARNLDRAIANVLKVEYQVRAIEMKEQFAVCGSDVVAQWIDAKLTSD